MKKAIFTTLLLSFFAFANAQVSTTVDGYKQYAGARSLEVQFAPLGGSPISIGGIRLRNFTSDAAALRLNAFLGFSSDSEVRSATNQNGDDVLLKDVTSSFTLEFRPGIEYHLSGTERLSPYYGVEGIIGLRSSAEKNEDIDTDGTTIISNKTRNPNNDGYFRVGANAIMGVDYYFSRSIYLGTEVGFGLQLNLQNDEVEVPDSGEKTTTSEGGASFDIGPNAVGQIRLGFLF